MAQGILIAVEGIDGAGKTTLVQRLSAALSDAGEQVTASKEPTNGPWGKKLRDSATTGRLSLEEELHAFIEDRKEHLAGLVQPSLDRGKTVILDRYFYSTVAYQGARGADVETVAAQMRELFPIPDMTILLDASPFVTVDRISAGRGETPNHFERVDELTKVRKIFAWQKVQFSEIHQIDAHQDADAVFLSAAKRLLETTIKVKRCAKSYGCDGLNCSFRESGTCQWATIYSALLRSGQAVPA